MVHDRALFCQRCKWYAEADWLVRHLVRVQLKSRSRLSACVHSWAHLWRRYNTETRNDASVMSLAVCAKVCGAHLLYWTAVCLWMRDADMFFLFFFSPSTWACLCCTDSIEIYLPQSLLSILNQEEMNQTLGRWRLMPSLIHSCCFLDLLCPLKYCQSQQMRKKSIYLWVNRCRFVLGLFNRFYSRSAPSVYSSWWLIAVVKKSQEASAACLISGLHRI